MWGRPDNAIVLRKGSTAEMSSGIDDPNVGLILATPGVVKDHSGAPLGIGEMVMVLALEKVGTAGGVSNVGLRGVPDRILLSLDPSSEVAKKGDHFRPESRIVAGRAARPGTDEAVIGKRLRGRFKGLDIGQTFELRKNRPATVVGVFDDGGSSFESEVWIDLNTMRASLGREGAVSSVRVRLTSPDAFPAFKAAVESDKNLGFQVSNEVEFYKTQSSGTSTFISVLGIIVTVIFSMGAMTGAMITMYGAVSDRQREIGTLRALGFSKGSILFSFLFESFLLALFGGAVGIAASLALGAVKFSMINFQSFSEVVFSFNITPGIILTSFIVAGVMGILGGFFPARRAASITALEALRG
jgi:putative ABC transport system permease protein